MSKKIAIYDTTLRDGCQCEDISFTISDKLRITERLDDFGVRYVEGGWPGSNPRDDSFFEQAARLRLKHARLAAFGSTCRAGMRASQDKNLARLIHAKTPVVTIFGKSWDLHVRDDLIYRVSGRFESPVNHGNLCVKGRFGTDFVHAADRLTQPLVRADGRLDPASWETALDLTTRRLQEIGLQYGFLNQPVQVHDLRCELRELLDVALWPQVIVRLGHGKPVRRATPRRPLEQALLH